MKIYPLSLYFIIVILILGLSSAAGAARRPAAERDRAGLGPGADAGRVDRHTGLRSAASLEKRRAAPKTTSDADGNFYFTLLQPSEDTWSYRLVVTRGAWGATTTQQFSVMANSATIVQVRVYPYIRQLLALSATGRTSRRTTARGSP